MDFATFASDVRQIGIIVHVAIRKLVAAVLALSENKLSQLLQDIIARILLIKGVFAAGTRKRRHNGGGTDATVCQTTFVFLNVVFLIVTLHINNTALTKSDRAVPTHDSVDSDDTLAN